MTFLRARWKFFRQMHSHWAFKAAGVVWFILSALSVGPVVLPQKVAQVLTVVPFLPKWPWYVWVIGFLTIFLLMVFEGGHQLHKKLQTSVPSDSDPRVILRFDWEDKLELRTSLGTVRNKPITLINRGGSDAYNIKVQDIKLRPGAAVFNLVPTLFTNSEVKIPAEIQKPEGVGLLFRNDLELLIIEDWKIDGEIMDEPSVPVVVSYEDHAGNKYETHEDLNYVVFWRTAETKNYRFLKNSSST